MMAKKIVLTLCNLSNSTKSQQMAKSIVFTLYNLSNSTRSQQMIAKDQKHLQHLALYAFALLPKFSCPRTSRMPNIGGLQSLLIGTDQQSKKSNPVRGKNPS